MVVMGTGEPLDNYDNLVEVSPYALPMQHGLHISQRNVTVSTCGIVPKDSGSLAGGESADHPGAISARFHTGEDGND